MAVTDTVDDHLCEIEKIKLFYSDDSATIDSAQVEQMLAKSSEQKAWSLVDPVLKQDSKQSLQQLLDLYSQGETTGSLLYVLVGRVKLALEVIERLRAGESDSAVQSSLRMPPKVAAGFIASVKRFKQSDLRSLLNSLMQVELSIRSIPDGVGELDAPFGRISSSETALLKALVPVES